jgi:hypothetical protein
VCVFPLLLLCLGVSVATVIPDGYTLVPSKGKRITSLSELKDGVYFVELFASRTECGGSPTQGTGGIVLCQDYIYKLMLRKPSGL